MSWTSKLLSAMGPLGSIASGVLAAGGVVATNRANRQQAREQMAFQERMSNTAVQRSAADYAAAGFNPLNAVNNSASSPGGASATMGDALGSGISSARASRLLQSQLAQSAKTLELTKAQAREANAKAKMAESDQSMQDTLNGAYLNALKGQPMAPSPLSQLANARIAREIGEANGLALANQRTAQVLRHTEAQLPYMLRQMSLDNLLTSYNAAVAGIESKYQAKFGTASRAARDIGNLVGGARGVSGILRDWRSPSIEDVTYRESTSRLDDGSVIKSGRRSTSSRRN